MKEEQINARSTGEGVVRFALKSRRIVEVTTSAVKWSAVKSDIKKGILAKSSEITVSLLGSCYGKSGEYPCRNTKTFIKIGCMRFTGEDANKLRKWALAKNGAHRHARSK